MHSWWVASADRKENGGEALERAPSQAAVKQQQKEVSAAGRGTQQPRTPGAVVCRAMALLNKPPKLLCVIPPHPIS